MYLHTGGIRYAQTARLLSGDAFSVMLHAGWSLPRVSAHFVRLALGYELLGFQPEQSA